MCAHNMMCASMCNMIVHIHSYATCAYVSQPKGFKPEILAFEGGTLLFFREFSKTSLKIVRKFLKFQAFLKI